MKPKEENELQENVTSFFQQEISRLMMLMSKYAEVEKGHEWFRIFRSLYAKVKGYLAEERIKFFESEIKRLKKLKSYTQEEVENTSTRGWGYVTSEEVMHIIKSYKLCQELYDLEGELMTDLKKLGLLPTEKPEERRIE